MFIFDKGMLFILSSKNLVTKLRNLALLEKDTESASLSCVEVTNATGTHAGVGFACHGHPTVLYFEEEKQAQQPEAAPATETVVEPEKTDEQNK